MAPATFTPRVRQRVEGRSGDVDLFQVWMMKFPQSRPSARHTVIGLRALVIDIRSKIKQPLAPSELRDLLSSIDVFAKGQAASFSQVKISGNPADLPKAPRWTSRYVTSDWPKLLAASPGSDKRDIADFLAASLITPTGQWDATPSELRLTFPKGRIIFYKTSGISADQFTHAVENIKGMGIQLPPVLSDVKLPQE